MTDIWLDCAKHKPKVPGDYLIRVENLSIMMPTRLHFDGVRWIGLKELKARYGRKVFFCGVQEAKEVI